MTYLCIFINFKIIGTMSKNIKEAKEKKKKRTNFFTSFFDLNPVSC